MGPRVFETYKSLWEVFHEDGTAPTTNFNDYDTAAHNACKVNPQFGDVVLASSTAFGDIGQSGFGTLVGPLVAQNGRYVRYQTLYNQPAYDFIVANKYYLQKPAADRVGRGRVSARRCSFRTARSPSRRPGST